MEQKQTIVADLDKPRDPKLDEKFGQYSLYFQSVNQFQTLGDQKIAINFIQKNLTCAENYCMTKCASCSYALRHICKDQKNKTKFQQKLKSKNQSLDQFLEPLIKDYILKEITIEKFGKKIQTFIDQKQFFRFEKLTNKSQNKISSSNCNAQIFNRIDNGSIGNHSYSAQIHQSNPQSQDLQYDKIFEHIFMKNPNHKIVKRYIEKQNNVQFTRKEVDQLLYEYSNQCKIHFQLLEKSALMCKIRKKDIQITEIQAQQFSKLMDHLKSFLAFKQNRQNIFKNEKDEKRQVLVVREQYSGLKTGIIQTLLNLLPKPPQNLLVQTSKILKSEQVTEKSLPEIL